MLVVSSIIIVTITYITFTVIKFFWNRRRLYKLASKIPGYNGLPLLGIVLKFLKFDKKDFFDRTFKMMKPGATMTKIWVGPQLMLMTKDADVIHTIFNSPNCINKPGVFYHSLSIRNGLIPLSGERYHKHKRLLNKSFTLSMLQKLQPVVNAKCERFINKLGEKINKEVNLLEYVGACVLESFGEGQCGYSANLYGFEVFRVIKESLDIGLDRITKPWLHLLPQFAYKMLSISKKMDKIVKWCDRYNRKVFEVYSKKKLEGCEEVKNRVVDVLFNPDNNFSDIEVRDEMILFTAASFDTTAKTLSFLILMAAMFPKIQKELVDEIESIYETDENPEFNFDFFKKFEYMEMVIKETMRLFPTGPSVARTNDAEIEVGGYLIPKDSIFMISLASMHKSPKYWGHDADSFKPERFAGELKYPRAFAPFTGGKRLCLGYRYANMFMKTLLINFFRTYQVKTALKFDEMKIVLGITIILEQDFLVTIEKRNKV